MSDSTLIQEQRFEYTRGPYDRFWEYQFRKDYEGTYLVVTRWGRIGSAGTVSRNTFSTRAQALKYLDVRLTDKLNKGYDKCGNEPIVTVKHAQVSSPTLSTPLPPSPPLSVWDLF